MKFETGQKSNFRANKCQHFYCFAVIGAWSNNVAPAHAHYMPRIHCDFKTQINMASEMENVNKAFNQGINSNQRQKESG